MKKLIFTSLGIICFAAMAIAQPPVAKPAPPAPPEKPQMSKEQRMEMKAKEEANMNEAFKAAELAEDEMTKAREIMAESNRKMRELRSNEKMTEEEKAATKKEINDDKTTKLKALMGAEKYKLYNEARKKQKAAMEARKVAE